jgi:2-polyprenyl-3-methyl-5-hydroxy-6-metoxy-1,4-benzoquinol methylase
MSILDIGCASGELALALTKEGHQVFGTDLNREMVHLAREKAKSLGLRSKVEFLERDMTNIGTDFLPAFFDAVLCFGNTLVHLENLGKIEEFFINSYFIDKSCRKMAEN